MPIFSKKRLTSFSRDVITVLLGAASAQFISLLSLPILTRLYSKTDFGLFTTFLSMVSIIGAISTLRYESAIVLPKEEKEGNSLTLLAGIASLSIATTIGLVIVLCQLGDVSFPFKKELGLLIYFLPLAIALEGLELTFSNWNTRNKNFKRVSLSKIFLSIIRPGGQIALFPTFLQSSGLILGGIIARFANLLYLSMPFLSKRQNRYIDIKQMLYLSRKYSNFPKYDVFSALLITIYTAGIPLILTKFFSLELVGLYALSYRILVMPSTLFARSYGNVFYQRIAQLYHEDTKKFKLTVNSSFKKLIINSLAPYTLFVFSTPYLIGPIFGQEWKDAHKLIFLLAPSVYQIIYSRPLSFILKVIDRQDLSLILWLVKTSTKFGAVYIGYYFTKNLYFTVFLFSLVSTVMDSIINIIILKTIHLKPSLTFIIINTSNLLCFIFLYLFNF